MPVYPYRGIPLSGGGGDGVFRGMVGAISVKVPVNTSDWCGDVLPTRELFCNGLDDGIFGLERAQVIRLR